MKNPIYLSAILVILVSLIFLFFSMNNSSSPFIINTFDGQTLYAKEIVDSVDMYRVEDNHGRTMIIPKTSVNNIIINK